MIDKHLKLQFGFLYNLELDFYEQSVQGPFWLQIFKICIPLQSWDN